MNTPPKPQNHLAHNFSYQHASPVVATTSNRAASWPHSSTIGDKLVLLGGVVALVSFLLPWVTISFFFTTASASGISLARQMAPALWAFPAMMAGVIALSIFTLSRRPRGRLLTARWFVTIGAA